MISVVIPCLNEQETVGLSVDEARTALDVLGYPYEILVVDNGSTDGSAHEAIGHGATVIQEPRKGYGQALMTGVHAAEGEFIIMGDADHSYDFGAIPRLVGGLQAGADLVVGCRLPIGGGVLRPGSMPLLNFCGNMVLSWFTRMRWGVPLHDVYCGFRGVRTVFMRRMDVQYDGMEYAVAMILRTRASGGVIAELPIVFRPDSRVRQRSHLRIVRDGLRTLLLLLRGVQGF